MCICHQNLQNPLSSVFCCSFTKAYFALLAVGLVGSFGSMSLSRPNNCSNLAYTDVLLYTCISKVSKYKLSLVLECDKSEINQRCNINYNPVADPGFPVGGGVWTS